MIPLEKEPKNKGRLYCTLPKYVYGMLNRKSNNEFLFIVSRKSKYVPCQTCKRRHI